MMEAQVKNLGKATARKVQVELSTASYANPRSFGEAEGLAPQLESIPTLLIDRIKPGQTETRRFPVYFRQPGTHAVVATLQDDSVLPDNRRWATVECTSTTKVLIVGNASTPQNKTPLLTALSPNRMTGIEPVIKPKSMLRDVSLDALQEYTSIFLIDVDRLDASAVEVLQQYVMAGGGLVFFAGPNMHQPFYNSSLYQEGSGIYPMPIERIAGIPLSLDGQSPDIVPTRHPIFTPVFDVKHSLLDLVQVEKVVRPPMEWAPAGNQVSILATVRGDKNLPLVVEKTMGRGARSGCDDDGRWNLEQLVPQRNLSSYFIVDARIRFGRPLLTTGLVSGSASGMELCLVRSPPRCAVCIANRSGPRRSFGTFRLIFEIPLAKSPRPPTTMECKRRYS